jgi:hypothetical protein
MPSALVAAVVLFGAVQDTAQSSVGAGVTVGTAQLSSARSERALTGVIQLQPVPWLTFSATPAFVRVSHDTNGTTASTEGLGDLPISAGVTTTLPSSWSPTLGGALTVDLPTGNATCGLGSGSTTAGVDVGVEVAPAEGYSLSAGASRSLSGLAAQSSLRPPQATSLDFDGSANVASDWTLGLSIGLDVGTADSTQALSRTVGAGITHNLGGALALTIDASHGLTSGSPRWVLSVGLGTVFSGVSPVAGTSPLRRLQRNFTGGVKGGNKGGKTGSSC